MVSDTAKLPLSINMSNIIGVLRFPLAILVVFIHSFGDGPVTTFIQDRGDVRIYDILRVSISHGIASVAVPCFFLFSGYLFFSHKTYGQSDYWQKMKRKSWTLLIPYLFWNLIPFLYILAKRICGAILHKDASELGNYISSFSFYHTFWANEIGNAATIDFHGATMPLAMPLNYPLWFLRDLILLAITSPAIFYLIKSSISRGILPLLGIVFLCGLWPFNAWISISAVFFFYVGAYIRIKEVDLIEKLHRFRYVTYTTATLLLILIACGYRGILNNLFILCGVTTLLLLAFSHQQYLQKTGWAQSSPSAFFIYLSHMLFVSLINIHVLCFVPILRKLGDSELLKCCDYLIEPFFVMMLCLVLQYLMKRFMPRVYQISIGNR